MPHPRHHIPLTIIPNIHLPKDAKQRQPKNTKHTLPDEERKLHSCPPRHRRPPFHHKRQDEVDGCCHDSKKRRDDRVHPFRWGGGFVSVVEIPPVQAYDCEAEDELDEAEDGLEKSDEGVPGWGGVGGKGMLVLRSRLMFSGSIVLVLAAFFLALCFLASLTPMRRSLRTRNHIRVCRFGIWGQVRLFFAGLGSVGCECGM